MLNKETTVTVTNRNNATLSYLIPDLGVNRMFSPGETKEMTLDEVRKLSYIPGGLRLIKHYLVIFPREAAEEILGELEPEYYYDRAAIKNLLLNGSLDELLDCLDFAPGGVIDLIKDIAVSERLNEVNKREAIYEKIGFNIGTAIQHSEAIVNAPKKSPINKRRVASIEEERAKAKTVDETPHRRTAPKYNVVSKG